MFLPEHADRDDIIPAPTKEDGRRLEEQMALDEAFVEFLRSPVPHHAGILRNRMITIIDRQGGMPDLEDWQSRAYDQFAEQYGDFAAAVANHQPTPVVAEDHDAEMHQMSQAA